MTQEIKTNWLDILKSGQYKQGIGQLRQDKDGIISHCCLGVLGEICNIEIDKRGNKFIGDEISELNSIYPSLLKYLTKEQMDELCNMNDALGVDENEEIISNEGYTNVIPYIEAIICKE